MQDCNLRRGPVDLREAVALGLAAETWLTGTHGAVLDRPLAGSPSLAGSPRADGTSSCASHQAPRAQDSEPPDGVMPTRWGWVECTEVGDEHHSLRLAHVAHVRYVLALELAAEPAKRKQRTRRQWSGGRQPGSVHAQCLFASFMLARTPNAAKQAHDPVPRYPILGRPRRGATQGYRTRRDARLL